MNVLPQLAIDVTPRRRRVPMVRDGVELTDAQAAEINRIDSRFCVSHVSRPLVGCDVLVRLAVAVEAPGWPAPCLRIDPRGRVVERRGRFDRPSPPAPVGT